jgi:hypothetical protein
MYVIRFVANAKAVLRVNLSEHVFPVLCAAGISGARPVSLTIRSPVDHRAKGAFVNGFGVAALAAY